MDGNGSVSDVWQNSVLGMADRARRHCSDIDVDKMHGSDAMESRSWIGLDGKIKVIGRLSSQTVAVSWSHAQLGSYKEQIWRATSATGLGVCALSGKDIMIGDAIYRPRKCERSLIKASATILASALDGTLETL
jgi:Domain of unknown function (DUF3331)